MRLDTTRLMAVKPPKHFNNCKISDVDPMSRGSTVTPREIEIVLPDADGSKVLAMYYGLPQTIAVDDYLRVRRDTTDTNIYIVEGAGGGTSGTISLALDDLSDVTTAGVGDGDVLTYDTGTPGWVAAAPAGGGGNVWPLEGDLTNTNDGVSFATVALLIAALAAGEQGLIGNGTYTSDDVDITENIRLLGSGIDATILQTTTDDKVLDFNTGDCLLEGFTLKNTGTSANSYALYSISSSLQLTRIKMVLTGAATNNNGAYLAIGTHKLYDCVFNVAGGTNNTALYVDDNTTVDLFNASIEAGNVSVNYSANPVTVSFFGGTIVGNIAADGSGATVKLYGTKITGTLTVTNTAKIIGWYYDTNGKLTRIGTGTELDMDGLADGIILDTDADTTISSPTDDQIDFETGGADRATLTNAALTLTGTVDVFPQASANGLNARFERLFGDDVPANTYLYTRRMFRANAVASNIIGFEDNQASPYSPPAGNFTITTPANTTTASTSHWLALTNNTSASPCYLEWTNASALTVFRVIVAFEPLASGSDVLVAELRVWSVQAPGANDRWWALRWCWDGTTRTQYPFQVSAWYSAAAGDGLTFAATTGTLIARGPAYQGIPILAQIVTIAGPSAFFTIFCGEGYSAFSSSSTSASMPASVKTARFMTFQQYQTSRVDEMWVA